MVSMIIYVIPCINLIKKFSLLLSNLLNITSSSPHLPPPLIISALYNYQTNLCMNSPRTYSLKSTLMLKFNITTLQLTYSQNGSKIYLVSPFKNDMNKSIKGHLLFLNNKWYIKSDKVGDNTTLHLPDFYINARSLCDTMQLFNGLPRFKTIQKLKQAHDFTCIISKHMCQLNASIPKMYQHFYIIIDLTLKTKPHGMMPILKNTSAQLASLVGSQFYIRTSSKTNISIKVYSLVWLDL